MTWKNDMQETLREFGNCARAFGVYRQSAVLTGGLVPFMYRHLSEVADPAGLRPLQTFDLDWTVPTPLVLSGASLHTRLVDSGFVVVLGGRQPHVERYQPECYGEALGPIYIEFLTPRKGGLEVHRRDRSVVSAQPDLNAQALPYLDLLLHSPLSFDASAVPGTGLEEETQILLPGPMAYVLQKLLARPRRDINKKATDQAHIYDVVSLWRNNWPAMRAELATLQAATFPDRWSIRARKLLANLYAGPHADGPVEVERVYGGVFPARPLKAATVHRMMQRFMKAIGWQSECP